MSNDFITVDQLNLNNIDADYNSDDDENNIDKKEEKFVYQFQADKDSKYAKIMKVGILNEIHDILIKEFDLSNKLKCYMTSIIYNFETLQNLEEACRFQLIKIIICNRGEKNIIPVAKLCYNFHTFEHVKNKNSIINYISDENKKMDLCGYFSITLHFQENNIPKVINVQLFKTFHGKNEMLNSLIKCLSDDNIKNILNKLA